MARSRPCAEAAGRATLALCFALAAASPALAEEPGPFTRKVRFEVRAPQAKEVYLLGRMAPEGPGLRLRRGDDWRWWALLDLAPGRWPYVFVVDGKTVVDELGDGVEPDGKGGARAFVEVLPEERWSLEDPKVPHGTVERHAFQSAILGREVHYTLWLPPGLDARRKLPALWLLHGYQLDDRSFAGGGALRILDNLLAAKRIAPFIAVMPEGGESFWRGEVERHLVEELVPHLAKGLPLSRCAAVAGTSMGGFGALWLSWRHPQTWGLADSLSAGLNEGFLAQLEADLPARPYAARLTVRCGKQDGLYALNRGLVQVLERRGVAHRAVFARGEHNFDYWRSVLPDVYEGASRWFGEGCPGAE